MLSEDAAWQLLKRYCEPLQEVQWPYTGFTGIHSEDDVLDRVDLIVSPMTILTSTTPATDTSERLAGARLRLALSVAYAVSCCYGFAPDTRQSFWWRVVEELWAVHPTGGRPVRFAFSPTAFAHVAISWTASSCRERWGHRMPFWIGFFHGTPACHAVLTAVLNKLRPYMVPGPLPPPLRVSLSQCYESDPTTATPPIVTPLPYSVEVEPVVAPMALRTILQAAIRTSSSPWPTPLDLEVSVDCHIDDDAKATRKTLALLARARTLTEPRVTVHRLGISLASPVLPPMLERPVQQAFASRARALAKLLRSVLRYDINKIAIHGCSHCDSRLVGAALSAVARGVQLPSRPVAVLQSSGLFYHAQSHDKLLRLAWLAYMLQCRRQSPSSSPLALELVFRGVAVDEAEARYVETLMALGTPLRDVVGEALRLRFGGRDTRVAALHSVECLRIRSSVRLAPGTRLYFEPFRETDAWVAETLSSAEDIDLVARIRVTEYGTDVSVGVVYVGFGLVWTAASSVIAWHQPGDDTVDLADQDVVMLESDGVNGAAHLSSLSISFQGSEEPMPLPLKPLAHSVAPLLPLVASTTLTELTMNRVVVTRDDLEQILSSFPSLTSLVLNRCLLESVDPLLDAYQQAQSGRVSTPRIAVLSLLGVLDLSARDELIDYGPLLEDVLGMHGELRSDDYPTWLPSFVEALAHGVTRGVLRELYIDLKGMRLDHDAEERELVARLARAVDTSALSLTRLHVTCRFNLQAECAGLLGPLHDDDEAEVYYAQ